MSQATQKNDMDTYIIFYFIYSLYKERWQYLFIKSNLSVKNMINLYENRWIAINIKSFRTFTQVIFYYKKMLPPIYEIHSLLH